jgi:hypothetical protein
MRVAQRLLNPQDSLFKLFQLNHIDYFLRLAI